MDLGDSYAADRARLESLEDDEMECLEAHTDECKGEVELRAVPGGSAVPRCVHHFEMRMDRYENSIESYANSDVAPSWFDPSIAGERWDDDY